MRLQYFRNHLSCSRHPERRRAASRRIPVFLSVVFAVAFVFAVAVVSAFACHSERSEEPPHFSYGGDIIYRLITPKIFPQKYLQSLQKSNPQKTNNPPSTFTTQFTTICPQNTTHNTPSHPKPLKNPPNPSTHQAKKNPADKTSKARPRSGASSRCRKQESS